MSKYYSLNNCLNNKEEKIAILVYLYIMTVILYIKTGVIYEAI